MTARFPSHRVVERAIAMQIYPSQIQLSQNLLQSKLRLPQSQPQIDITKVQIHRSEITVVENLPTYHLQGSYQVNLQLPRHEFKQNQPFDIYLQQQRQSKSWRLLIPEYFNKSKTPLWHGYRMGY